MSKRLHWPNRWIFILAAVGSAAGLGNLWRFPYMAYEHGGGAFVLALIIANIVIGIPLLALEVGMGQMTQKGAPDAFATIRKSFKYLGWFAMIGGLIVLSYYMAVMGWGVNYLASAFQLGWSADPSGFFFGDVLNLSDGPGIIGGISWPVFTGFIIAWVILYFCVWKGVESVSKVVKWSATLPFVILAILLVRALTLDGAMEGLKVFLIPDWPALQDPMLWMAAFSQVFFSLTLAFGVMIAYGSLNNKKVDITGSVVWIVLGNFLVSLMSGFVVFGTLGYMALTQGVGITEVVAGGPALAFVVFPQAITLLPALNSFVAVIFFLMVLTLGIDSAFSVFEAFAVPLKDRFPKLSTKKLSLILSAVAMGLGVIFTTGAGLYYLDIVDHFVVNYGFVIVGILEAIAVGWFMKGDKLKKYINKTSKLQLGALWSFAIKFFIPGFLTILLGYTVYTEINAPYEGYPMWALLCVGVLPLALAPFIGAIMDKMTSK